MGKKKKLRANDNLIVMVIKRQAGSVAKANLEGVMNSIDAGATKIDVHITNNRLAIIDNGKGFKSEAEVDDYFAEFGNPHELDDEGCSTDAKFGTFRIGRGQLFAFGVNTWHTNNIRLQVDVGNNNSLAFDYDEIDKVHKGCYVNVDLYETLTGRDLAECIRETEQFCRYVDVELTINGERANKPPSQQNWTKEDEFAYVKLKPDDQYSGIEIYQQGVYVETIPAHTYGMSGTVVTKVPVKLNFARNQVIRSCPKWKKITKLLTHESKEKAKKKKTTNFNTSEKVAAVRQFREGDIDLDDFFTMRVFEDVTGKDWSLSTLKLAAGEKSKFEKTATKQVQVAFAKRYDNMADKAMQSYKGIVIANECVEYLGYASEKDLQKVIEDGIRKKKAYGRRKLLEFTTVKDIMKGEDPNYTIIKDPTPTESIILEGLTTLTYSMESAAGVTDPEQHWRDARGRVIRLGDSTCADGWTDGKTYVVIDKKFLDRHLPLSPYGAVAVVQLYLHELCHNTPDTEGHGHDVEFYKKYHDEGRRIPDWASQLFDFYMKRLRMADRKLPTRIRRRVATMSEAVALHSTQEKAAELIANESK